MEKLLTFLRRPSNVGVEEFARRYLSDHAALIVGSPGVRRYVANLMDLPQDILEPLGFNAGNWTIDAVDEVWCESLDDLPDISRLYGDVRMPAVERGTELTAQGFGFDCFRVTERVHREWDYAWRHGEQSPVFKIFFPVRRSPKISHEQFVDHWMQSHVPLALKHHPGMRFYATNDVTSSLTRGAPEMDGVSVLHFLSAGEFQERMFDSPEGQAIIGADIVKFINFRASGAYVAREFVHTGDGNA